MQRALFLTGLFLITLATLCLEVLDTRLLSVVTWYHLSFFVISTAMFGTSAGALSVYFLRADPQDRAADRRLERGALLLALAIPVFHGLILVVPLPLDAPRLTPLALTLTTLAVAVPFYLSGAVVAGALVRLPGRVGLIYGVDLLGASLGTLLAVPVLALSNVAAGALLCGALAAAAAACFRLHGGGHRPWAAVTMAVALLCAALSINRAGDRSTVFYPKGRYWSPKQISREIWSIQSQVLVGRPRRRPPQYWGAGQGAVTTPVESQQILIDGAASTTLTAWNGDAANLAWVQHDVTSIPYHLRRGGDVAIVGAGGGRDVLTALWAGSRRVEGIEVNGAVSRLLKRDRREYAGIADRPEVVLVHDEARSYLTRTPLRYDVLQISLVDSWAATAAGAFTLTENALYTVEAWRIFLADLKPEGLLSVSRWHSPDRISETSRLVALAVAALQDRGVVQPLSHMALLGRENVATLLVSPSPLAIADVQRLHEVADRSGFEVVLAPDTPARNKVLRGIESAASRTALETAIADPHYDYSPPTDDRPFFFNMVRPGGLFASQGRRESGVMAGNMLATQTLLTLVTISLALAIGIALAPFVVVGRPPVSGRTFAAASLYFAAIGMGYMLVQMSYLQRLSLYLGDPSYAVVALLSSMILATGLGSFASRRLVSDHRLVPLALLTATAILGAAFLGPEASRRTIQLGLGVRCAIGCMLVMPVAFLLGVWFPAGMRAIEDRMGGVRPWMFGINGACAVFGAVASSALSLWTGITTGFLVAALLYGSLAFLAPMLWRHAQGESLR